MKNKYSPRDNKYTFRRLLLVRSTYIASQVSKRICDSEPKKY